MLVPAWIERLASDLLDLESELRPLLRRLAYTGATHTPGAQSVETRRAPGAYQSVTLSANEARTLLRAALPLPVSSTRMRKPHARMLAALQLFSAHLLSLNDEATAPDQAAVAGVALAAELRQWLAETRWHQACRAAGTRWPVAIITVPQPQTAGKREQTVNGLAALAESHRVGADPMGAQVARTARRKAAALAATADALDLAAASAPPSIATLRKTDETPAQAAARMQATTAAIATAASTANPPRPPATVEQLRHAAPTAPIATTTTRRGKAHAA